MKNIFKFVFVLVVVSGCQTKKAIDYIDPFIGTGFHGHTYPGATVPFGGVQLSPDTRQYSWDGCSGYHYSDSTILGFSHTHLSGTGCIDLGDVLFYPTSDEINSGTDGYAFPPIPFSHDDEVAEAGFYKVKLNNGVTAELTTTTHVGVHRYTFAKKGVPKIVINLAHLLEHEAIKESELTIGVNEISGMRCTDGWVTNQYVYFVAQFSAPFEARLLHNGKDIPANIKSAKGGNIQAVIHFPGSEGKALVCSVGISTVSVENARENLQAEVADFDFDKVKSKTQNTWEKALSAYDVSGGTTSELKNFYTALYHCMVTPNTISDVNEEYRGADMKTRKSRGHKIYSTFSLWDTFRAWNPLMTITDTALVNDMINSFLDFYDQTGKLPIWPLSSGETGTMVGYHAASVIYDAYSKNIRGYDVEKALKAMRETAYKRIRGTTPFVSYGFIPADRKRESVSRLLENCYDDWCIAELAKDLGEDDIYKEFIHRAQLYKNVFDGKTGFFRPRKQDGVWVEPFIPEAVARAYTEATAWQYRFFVLHDVNGLINLMGGQQEYTRNLDSLFSTTVEMKGSQSDISGLLGQYAHGNEPSHHMAYLYSFAGQPWKTQAMVRRLLDEMYHPTPEGIIGNEDCGQMSAWYVMSSLGLYAVCPGAGQYIFTSPLFKKANIRLANGKTLAILANDPAKNDYIKEVYFNGEPIEKNYITHQRLMEGGELKFVLSSEPNKVRGTSPETFPYSFSGRTKQVSLPFVSNDISFFEKDVEVHCGSATDDAEIYYTLNGSEPDKNSVLYTKPFKVDKTCTIKLKAYHDEYEPSGVAQYKASQIEYAKPARVNLNKRGIHYKYYEGTFALTSEVEENGEFKASGICEKPDLSMAAIPDHYGIVYSGYIWIPEKGIYSFLLQSDDGSVFFIDDKITVDNDGSHGTIKIGSRIALEKGFHPYKLIYFEDYEGEEITLSWIKPGEKEDVAVAPEYFFIK